MTREQRQQLETDRVTASNMGNKELRRYALHLKPGGWIGWSPRKLTAKFWMERRSVYRAEAMSRGLM